MILDERDVDILKTLSELGDPSPKRIEEETDIPKSTVHYRLQKLREVGIIENDLYELDSDAVGLGVRIISEVTAEFKEGYHETVGRQLREIEGVTHVYFTMGDTDFIVMASLPDSTYVQKLVRDYESVDGVIRTSSTMVISTLKEDANPLRSYDSETLRSFDLSSDD